MYVHIGFNISFTRPQSKKMLKILKVFAVIVFFIDLNAIANDKIKDLDKIITKILRKVIKLLKYPQKFTRYI